VNEALEKDDFELVYQPIMEVWDDSIDNYEVLVRLKQGPKLLLPHQFFPPAEKYGLMTAIDCWVVEHAIARLNKAEDQRREKAKQSGILPRRIRFFINISGYSLADKAVLSKLVKIMVAAKASPERIVLDVDERTVLSRMANASMLSRNIKKLKLEFALNHYTGQDNLLNYLKYMSIDYVKLKSDLIKDLEQSQRRKKLVNVIVERARANGIKTMACTVESMATMSYLYHIGFDYLQGYAVAHPSHTLSENVFRELVLSPSV
jgi:Amt family ammonium transporter